jgi:hypothetical protein
MMNATTTSELLEGKTPYSVKEEEDIDVNEACQLI